MYANRAIEEDRSKWMGNGPGQRAARQRQRRPTGTATLHTRHAHTALWIGEFLQYYQRISLTPGHRVRVEFLAGRLLLAFYSSFRWTPTFSVLLGFAGLLSNTFSVLLEIAIDAHAHAHAMCRHGNPAPHNLGAPSPWPFFRSSIPGHPPCDASELVDWQAPATAQCVHRLLLAHHIQPCRPRRCSHRGAHDAQAPQQAFTG